MQGLPNFLVHNFATPNNTLSISHSTRPLAAGPRLNAKIMESHLDYIESIHGQYSMKTMCATKDKSEILNQI